MMIYLCTIPSITSMDNDTFIHFFYDSEEDKYYSTARIYKPIYPLQLLNTYVKLYQEKIIYSPYSIINNNDITDNDILIKRTDLYIDEPLIIKSLNHDILQNIKDKIIYESI